MLARIRNYQPLSSQAIIQMCNEERVKRAKAKSLLIFFTYCRMCDTVHTIRYDTKKLSNPNFNRIYGDMQFEFDFNLVSEMS